MKKLKLLCAVAALIFGVSSAYADTSLLTEANGWQKITTISQNDILNNYYVFVDDAADLMLGIANSTKQGNNALFYQTSTNPVTDLTKVFYLEANESYYAMRNVKIDYLQFQTEWSNSSNDLRWRNNDQPKSIEWTRLSLEYLNGAWILTSTKYNRPLGIYDNHTGAPVVGDEIGANDTGKEQKFQIYAINRQKFAELMCVGATAESPKDLTELIFNSDFNNSDKTKDYGWTVSTKVGGNYNFNGAVEAWHYGDFDLYQTLNVPNGKYKVTVQAVNSTSAYVYAGSSKTYVTQAASGDFGGEKNSIANDANYGLIAAETTVTDGHITFGIADPNNGNSWLVFDNFKLYYLGGVDLTAFAAAYEDALLQAQAVWNLRSTTYVNVTGSEKDALEAALNTYGTCEATEEAYTTAASALNNAKDAFVNAKDSYDAFVFEKNHATTLGVTSFPTPTTAAQALEGVNTLKVSEHNAVIAKYTTDGSALFIPSWDKNNFDAMSNEHWSGKTSEYFDKNGTNFTSKIYKTVTLPEGHYVFYAAARGHTAAHASVKVTIDDATTEVPITMKGNRGYGINTSGAADFSPTSTYACNNEGFGWEWRHVAFDLASEKSVTIAIECGAGSTWAWVSAGDTRLVTYDNIAVSKNRYETALELAIAARDNTDYSNVTGTERDNLIAAINATTPTTKDGYDAAAKALEDALPIFTAAKASYDAYAAYKAETVAAFGSDFDVAAPTTADECSTAVQNLNIAQYNAVETGYPNSLISKIGEFSSWTMEATSGDDPDTPQTLDSEHWSGAKHTYYEQGKNGWSSTRFTVTYTKTATLPVGSYVIKVAARASDGVTGTLSATATENETALPNIGAYGKGINKAGKATWTEGEFARNGEGYGWQWRFLPFTVTEEGEVTITIKANTNSQYQWVSIADAELLSAEDIATAVAYKDTESNTIENVDVANVTITRKVTEGFNTVVLPFDLTQAQVQSAFGSGALVYAYTENSENSNNVTINFNSVSAGTISANVPVLVKATETSESQTFNGVKIVAAQSATVTGTNFDFVGTYAPIANIPAGDYFVGYNTTAQAGAIFKSEGATSINAFRAYIHAKTAGARVSNLYIDGEQTTNINTLEAVGISNGKIYNLNGQEVKKAQKGIYIVNGKKLLVK